jgi:tetratricopeptide (TPR) repeat protein
MAELCARRGRVATADALIERSLALRSDNLLAQRTRGLIRTKLGDWPEAVASLERALAFDPDDRLTLAMLEQARQGLARSEAAVARTPETSPAAADAESLARRALRWLKGRRGDG